MSEHYIQNGAVCFPLDSREWSDYKEYLEGKLAELEEQRKDIDVRIAEIHRTLNPVTIPPAKEEAVLPEKEFYSANELSNLIGVNKSCIYEACHKGGIPFTPFGENGRRFSREQVEEIRKGMKEGKYFSFKKNLSPPAPLENEVPACDAKRMLNCRDEDLRTLRLNGAISVIRKNGIYVYYDKATVLELAEAIKPYGSIENYLKLERKARKNISLKELAAKVNISESTLYDNCVAGKIPCHRTNGIWEFTLEDVEKIRSMKGHGQLPADSCQSPAASRIRNIYQIEGKCTCKDVCKKLSINSVEYNLLVRNGYLNGSPLSGEKKKGNPLYYEVDEVDALGDMMKADGGKDAFLLKLKKGL
jgi:excisionase family DNA binding protein